jgi:hypothetical protein
MVARAVTPEERLLRLIESGERAKKLAFWDVRAWAPLLLPDKNTVRRVVASWSPRRWAPRELNLKLLNRGLIALLVLVVAAIALNTQRVRPSPLDISRPVRSATPSAKEEQPLAALRPVEDYLREVEQRDLFNPVAPPPPPPEPQKEEAKAKAEPVTPPAPTKPPEPTALSILQEKAKALKLVGISWGPVPVAMIEDTAKRETSFLKGGDSINEMRIKAVLRDRVVLSYENAEYDLF